VAQKNLAPSCGQAQRGCGRSGCDVSRCGACAALTQHQQLRAVVRHMCRWHTLRGTAAAANPLRSLARPHLAAGGDQPQLLHVPRDGLLLRAERRQRVRLPHAPEAELHQEAERCGQALLLRLTCAPCAGGSRRARGVGAGCTPVPLQRASNAPGPHPPCRPPPPHTHTPRRSYLRPAVPPPVRAGCTRAAAATPAGQWAAAGSAAQRHSAPACAPAQHSEAAGQGAWCAGSLAAVWAGQDILVAAAPAAAAQENTLSARDGGQRRTRRDTHL
jgi:hypothetical protein